jgi:hypothetical protein
MPKRAPSAALLIACALASGCGHSRHPIARRNNPPPLSATGKPRPHYATVATGLPLALSPDARRQAILASLRKAVMGRAETRRDIGRVADQIGPLVAAACAQPDVQPYFARMAQDEGITAREARDRWVHMQEGDILLESGGDPEAVSSAGAVGVSQWMPGAGTHGTLAINRKESARLTGKIDPLEWKIAWLKYWAHPDLPIHGTLPANIPIVSRAQAAQKLPALESTLAMLRQKRQKIDRRYDPAAAVLAQTRYLLALYDRFPSPDWLFQAYHGGEAGVERLLHKYLGSEWTGSAAQAIRSGNGGHALTFEDVYLTTSPYSHTDVFLYLYGRGDDHRHYWWKLRVAEQAIALYRSDPREFEKQWLALSPGHGMEAVWYPDETKNPIANLSALKSADRKGRFAPVPDTALYALRPAPLDKANAKWYRALRPETLGLLNLVAASYRECGGTTRLTVGDCALTQAYAAEQKTHFAEKPSRFPMPPDAEIARVTRLGPPARFDYHTTGIDVDILTPADRTQKKILDYVLGYFKDRGILAWREEGVGSEPKHVHMVANPQYATTLSHIRAGSWPEIPGV